MSSNTKIEWTDCSWNPVVGCTRASEGCDQCYSVRMTYRLEAMGQVKYRGLTVLNPRGDRHFNGVMRTDEDALTIPLSWRKPRRVFVNSMSDLFHKDVPEEFIHDVLLVCGACGCGGGWHEFQILTKRPERAAEVLNRLNDLDARNYAFQRSFSRVSKLAREKDKGWLADYANNTWWPLPNVWLGTSVENQGWADKRIPHLLRCPAAVRFLSCEPLLGAIEFSDVSKRSDAVSHLGKRALSGIDWVIVGGESGTGARPMHPDWARSIRDQCSAAGVAFFFKQWGEYGPGSVMMDTGERVFRQFENKQRWINKGSTWVNGGTCVDLAGKILRIGGDFDTAEYPVVVTHRQGKKASGRLLDGREWNEFPKVTE